MPLRGLERLADAHGPIYQVWLNGKRRIVCSSAELMEELTDERRFVKVPPPTLSQTPGPKGLFTAPSTDDPDWGQAHRILMPAFAPLSVRDMFPDMRDIANQLVLSWARKETKILLTEDFTRLTLDTIALCTMSHRFNSFYSDTANPFVEAMMVVFKENTARATRPSLATKLMFKANTQRAEAAAVMNKIGRAIVDNRRAHPTDARDVLNTMIYGEDPKTGEVMRDELVIQEMITFLIAGKSTKEGINGMFVDLFL
jgi:cytochrome P450/NADPH-cytochrome P450 reductase